MENEFEASPFAECALCKLKGDAAVQDGGIALLQCPVHGNRIVYNITFKNGRLLWEEAWQKVKREENEWKSEWKKRLQ